jgi:hypothetical protein
LKAYGIKPSSSSILSSLVDKIKYPPGLKILFISRRSLPPENWKSTMILTAKLKEERRNRKKEIKVKERKIMQEVKKRDKKLQTIGMPRNAAPTTVNSIKNTTREMKPSTPKRADYCRKTPLEGNLSKVN